MGHFDEITANTLGESYTCKKEHLKSIRKVFLVVNLFSTFFSIVYAFQTKGLYGFFSQEAFLTLWGVWACTLYFLLIQFAVDSPHDSKFWKFTYILGECAFCMEFLICPFFWTVLCPLIFISGNMTVEFFCLNFTVHFLTSITIYFEVYYNSLKFISSHRVFLLVVTILYSINNFLWTIISGTPVYPVITYKNVMSYVFLAISFVIAFGGFEFGRWQYNKKTKNQSRLISDVENTI